MLTELAQNPNKSSLAVCLSHLIHVLPCEERSEFGDVLRVFPEDILENNHGFIGHIVDPKTQEGPQLHRAVLGDTRKADDDSAKAPDRALGDLRIDICDILAQLVHNLLDVVLTGNVAENLELDVLNVARLIVFHEELLVLVFEVDVSLPQN